MKYPLGQKTFHQPVLTSSPPKWKSSKGKIFFISETENNMVIIQGYIETSLLDLSL